MPKPAHTDIYPLCRKRIAATKNMVIQNDRFEARLVRRVEKNIASGRFKRHRTSLSRYIDKVIHFLICEGDRVAALAQSDDAEWNRLRDFLCMRAAPMVRHFRSSTQANADALDLAHETCILLLDIEYPFDVSFDAWVTRILKNKVLAYYTRTHDILTWRHSPASLDDLQPTDEGSASLLAELIADLQSLAPFEKVENQDALRHAIEQLRSPEQRRIIRAIYFEDMSSEELARALKKSKQAIYNLRKRALEGLAKILAETRVKESPSRIHKTNRGVL